MASAFTPTRIMGVINITPDSFSDGGRFLSHQRAIEHGLQLWEEGADLLDIGGESTRPGAEEVPVDEELRRVIPVIEGLRAHGCDCLSIDTRKATVMREAVQAGATMINDVSALSDDYAISTAAELDVDIVLMHMQGNPGSMQANPQYDDVITEVRDYLLSRVQICQQAGIEPTRLLIDPGFGFGKSLTHNYQLLANLSSLQIPEIRLLVGLSRKSMIGNLLHRAVDERLPGSLAGALLAVQQGVDVIRVHDVAATRDVLRVYEAVHEHGLSA